MVILEVLARWLHVGAAIVLVGGSVYTRFILMPAAEPLPASEHDLLRERIRKAWAKTVGMGIGLLLLSGLFNFIRAMGMKPGPLYHALIGSKILIAFVVFFLASALAGKSPAFEGLRKNRKKWLGLTIFLAAIVVALAGVVKVVGRGTPKSAETAQQAAVAKGLSV